MRRQHKGGWDDPGKESVTEKISFAVGVPVRSFGRKLMAIERLLPEGVGAVPFLLSVEHFRREFSRVPINAVKISTEGNESWGNF